MCFFAFDGFLEHLGRALMLTKRHHVMSLFLSIRAQRTLRNNQGLLIKQETQKTIISDQSNTRNSEGSG